MPRESQRNASAEGDAKVDAEQRHVAERATVSSRTEQAEQPALTASEPVAGVTGESGEGVDVGASVTDDAVAEPPTDVSLVVL